MQNTTSVFTFHEASQSDVLKYVKAIPLNKASGLDQIPSCIIRLSIDYILLPLTHIMNLSLSKGVIPNAWKIARITPLHKGGDRTKVSNYRPISVLPVLSKVLKNSL